MSSLIGRTLKRGSLPTSQEVATSATKLARNVRQNPVRAFRRGMLRDKAARRVYHRTTGKTAGNVAASVAAGVYDGGGKDLAVNLGGLAGSIAGAGPGGKLGQLAGDWAGAAIARRSLDGAEAMHHAAKIRNNPAFQKKSIQEKADILARRASKHLKASGKKFKDSEIKSDTLGWAIGNGAAETLQQAGSGIPLQGGLVALATQDKIGHGLKVGARVANNPHVSSNPLERMGTGLRMGLVASGRKLRKIDPLALIRGTPGQENKLKAAINSRLQRLPKVPAKVGFSKKSYFLNFRRAVANESIPVRKGIRARKLRTNIAKSL